MPLYDYKCTSCGRTTEVRHGFDVKHDAPCPHCGGALARVFNPAPIVFKGSGFYINDSRPTASSNSPASAAQTKAETTTPTTGEAKTEAKADAPAPPVAQTKTESTSGSAA